MRAYLLLAHRYIGLLIAGFLLQSGLSGALISWSQPLDAWLNPQWFHQESPATPRNTLDLVAQLEQEHPHIQVTTLPLMVEPGHNLMLWVQARESGQPLDFNQVFVDSQTGQLLGERQWGQLQLDRSQLIPLLYQFHYSLLLPGQWGIWLLGAVAILWFIDCFIALAIAAPGREHWRKAFSFRLRSGRAKAVFDLHRSGGIWLWLLLVPFACTAISMNLGQQLVRPLVANFSPLNPSPFERDLSQQQLGPWLPKQQLLQIAKTRAQQIDTALLAQTLSCIESLQLCGVGFKTAKAKWIDLGTTWVYLDAHSGAITAEVRPGNGSRGEQFLNLQLPLHSGRIFGTSGAVAVSIFGVMIALLSATGLWLWQRRCRARAA